MFIFCRKCNKIHAKYDMTRKNDYVVTQQLNSYKEGFTESTTETTNLGIGTYYCPICVNEGNLIFFIQNLSQEDINRICDMFENTSDYLIYIDLNKLSPEDLLFIKNSFHWHN